MRPFLLLVAALVALFIATRGRTPSSPARSPSSVTAPVAPTSTQTRAPSGQSNGGANDRGAVTSTASSGKGFRSRDRLDEHYAKHGAEFGSVSEAQYLGLAQALRDSKPGGDILEIVRPADGVVSRFDKRSGAFLAFDRDGTIRTFFKPNDGERYFRRQANRPPSP